MNGVRPPSLADARRVLARHEADPPRPGPQKTHVTFRRAGPRLGRFLDARSRIAARDVATSKAALTPPLRASSASRWRSFGR
jgi:hypothetical protein